MQITPSTPLLQALSNVTSPQGAARTGAPADAKGVPHSRPTDAAAEPQAVREPNPPASPPPPEATSDPDIAGAPARSEDRGPHAIQGSHGESHRAGNPIAARFRRGSFLDIRV